MTRRSSQSAGPGAHEQLRLIAAKVLIAGDTVSRGRRLVAELAPRLSDQRSMTEIVDDIQAGIHRISANENRRRKLAWWDGFVWGLLVCTSTALIGFLALWWLS